MTSTPPGLRIYPKDIHTRGVGDPGASPNGRTLAVRPPVFPSVGTLFFAFVRLVLPAAPALTHPSPSISLPSRVVSRVAALASRGWWVLSGGVPLYGWGV